MTNVTLTKRPLLCFDGSMTSHTHHPRQAATRYLVRLAYRTGQHILASITADGPRDRQEYPS